MLVINDEQVAQRLQQIAERENRPVEDVLKSMIARYPEEALAINSETDRRDSVKRIRQKAYTKARQYWLSVNDAAKAALTDEVLNEQFGRFDEEGIPRLKSELVTLEPPIGSLAYAAKIALEADIHTGHPLNAANADEIYANSTKSE